MKKYVIITWGKQGMRGVQVRGLRIASTLPADEVVIINDAEGAWMKDKGYSLLELPLHEFLPPSLIQHEIIERYQPRLIIFADRPSNLISGATLLLAADNAKIPVVYFENYYSDRKLSEQVYRLSESMADLVIYNGLSSARHIETDKRKVLPPFIHQPTAEKVAWWREKIHLSADDQLITFFTYNQQTAVVVDEIIRSLSATHPNLKLFVTGKTNQEPKFSEQKNVLHVPFLDQEDMAAVMSLSTVIIGKMGYLQFLEALCLGKIFISVGKEKGYRKYWLQDRLKKVSYHFDDFDVSFVAFVNELLTEANKRKAIETTIASLHDGSLFDSEALTLLLRSVSYHPKIIGKRVLLIVVTGENSLVVHQAKEYLQREPMTLPLILFTGNQQKEQMLELLESELSHEGVVSAVSAGIISYLTPWIPYALPNLYAWQAELLGGITKLLQDADEVVVMGEETRYYFASVLTEIKGKVITYE